MVCSDVETTLDQNLLLPGTGVAYVGGGGGGGENDETKIHSKTQHQKSDRKVFFEAGGSESD